MDRKKEENQTEKTSLNCLKQIKIRAVIESIAGGAIGVLLATAIIKCRGSDESSRCAMMIGALEKALELKHLQYENDVLKLKNESLEQDLQHTRMYTENRMRSNTIPEHICSSIRSVFGIIEGIAENSVWIMKSVLLSARDLAKGKKTKNW